MDEDKSYSSVVRLMDWSLLGQKESNSIFIPTSHDRTGNPTRWSTPESRAMSSASPCSTCSGYGSYSGVDCYKCKGFIHPIRRIADALQKKEPKS
jgi:hypothetical protein